MTEKEKAILGLEFVRGDKDLKARRDRSEELCFKLNNISPDELSKRSEIIKSLINNIGDNFCIKSPFYCDYGDYITIGKNFFANYNCKLLDGGKITIGDNVFIGPDTTIVTALHAIDPEKRLNGVMQYKPVKIGDNVWIGSSVTICPGVEIGSNSVIGAGSVVTRSIPSNSLAVGSPCKFIKKI